MDEDRATDADAGADDGPGSDAGEPDPYAEPDPRLDHDTVDLLYAQTHRFCEVLAERGVLSGDPTPAVDATFADVDAAVLRRRAAEEGEPYLVTRLVFRVLRREGVAVGHGTPAEGPWEFGRLVDRCGALAEGLDGLTCAVEAVEEGAGSDPADERGPEVTVDTAAPEALGVDGAAGGGADDADGDDDPPVDRVRVVLDLDGRREAVVVPERGAGAAVEPVLDALNALLDGVDGTTRRFSAVPVADGIGVFLVEPGLEDGLGSFFELAGMLRRD